MCWLLCGWPCVITMEMGKSLFLNISFGFRFFIKAVWIPPREALLAVSVLWYLGKEIWCLNTVFGKQKLVLVSHTSCWSQLVLLIVRIWMRVWIPEFPLRAGLMCYAYEFDMIQAVFTQLNRNDIIWWIFPIIQTVIASVVKCCSLTINLMISSLINCCGWTKHF